MAQAITPDILEYRLRFSVALILNMERLNRIKEVLVNKNIKQKWLAEKLNHDVGAINLICNNKRQPSLKLLKKIADLLEVDIRDLLYSTWPKKNSD